MSTLPPPTVSGAYTTWCYDISDLAALWVVLDREARKVMVSGNLATLGSLTQAEWLRDALTAAIEEAG